jgi:hypothetical protein
MYTYVKYQGETHWAINMHLKNKGQGGKTGPRGQGFVVGEG